MMRLDLAEDRRVLHSRAEIHADESHRTGDEERNPPGPIIHRLLPEPDREAEHQQRAEGKAGERAELEEAAVEAAPVVGGIFGHERRRAAVLAAGRETLDHPQHHQQGRGPQADGLVRRDQAYPDGRRRHQQDRHREDRLAPVAISQRPPEQPAERPDQERDRERGEREQRGLGRFAWEQRRGDVDDTVGVDPVVEPFGRVAERRSGDRSAQDRRRCRFRMPHRHFRPNRRGVMFGHVASSGSCASGSSEADIGVVRGSIW